MTEVIMRIVLGLTVAPILANEVVTEQSGSKLQVITQDNKPSPSVKDIFFHQQGVGQSSSLGQRMLTPDQIQNITPEELAERERRMKMANAGVEAGVQGANAVGGILPTNGPEAILPGLIVGETVERVVDAKTAPPKNTPATETRNSTPEKPATQPETTPASNPKPQPVPQRDIGVRLNPNYVDPFYVDPAWLQKPGTAPEGPKPKPLTTEPKKKGSIRIELVPDKKNVTPQNVQLKARNLVR
jgi:hypothetical protein